MRRTLRAAGESAGAEAGSLREQTDVAIEQGQQMVDQVQALLRIDERIADVLHLLNVPSTRDLIRLQERLDALAATLEARDRGSSNSSQQATGQDNRGTPDIATFQDHQE